MGYFCDNEDEHRQDARRDFDRQGSYGYDREYYEHHTFDECKRAYTEEFDRARDEERRHEERREEERQEEQRQERQQQERWDRIRQEEEADYYAQGQQADYYRAMEAQQSSQTQNEELPF